MSIKSVMPSNHLILCCSLLFVPSIFPKPLSTCLALFTEARYTLTEKSVMWEFLALKSESESRSVISTSLRPHGLYSPWNSPGQNTGVSNHSLLQGNLPNPGIELRSPTLQVDSSPAEPAGKPKNTAVGSLSLLQGNILTQESNGGLLHWRQIL